MNFPFWTKVSWLPKNTVATGKTEYIELLLSLITCYQNEELVSWLLLCRPMRFLFLSLYEIYIHVFTLKYICTCMCIYTYMYKIVMNSKVFTVFNVYQSCASITADTQLIPFDWWEPLYVGSCVVLLRTKSGCSGSDVLNYPNVQQVPFTSSHKALLQIRYFLNIESKQPLVTSISLLQPYRIFTTGSNFIFFSHKGKGWVFCIWFSNQIKCNLTAFEMDIWDGDGSFTPNVLPEMLTRRHVNGSITGLTNVKSVFLWNCIHIHLKEF